MTKFLSLLFVCLLMASCVDEIKRPIKNASPRKMEAKEVKVVAHLPVHIDSTNYLLHPIGELKAVEGGYFNSESSSSGGVFASGDQIRGRLTNIKFQQLNSEELVPLTDQRVQIYSARFLRQIFENTGKPWLLYVLADADSNGDGILNGEDAQSLYLSDISGENFRRLSPEGQNFELSQTLGEMNRLYFKTREDTNLNGEFEDKERSFLFYVDLGAEVPEVVNYDPLKS